MRIPFRTKIFLALVATEAALLGGALAVVERANAAAVGDLIASRVGQGEANFREHAERLREDLERLGRQLADSPRLRSCFEQEALLPKAGDEAIYEIQYYNAAVDALTITDWEGRPIAKRLWRAGLPHVPGEEPAFDRRPLPPPERMPESPLVRAVIGRPPDGDVQAPHAFLVEEGRLFQVAALPIADGERFLGVLVLGSEITDGLASGIHRLQADEDAAGYVVGERLIATHLPPPLRRACDAALAGPVRAAAPGRPVAFAASIEGRPYHVGLAPVHREDAAVPVFTALFISLRKHIETREAMRWRFLTTGAVGLLLSLLLSGRIARGISRPVRDLVEGTERIAGGDYAHRVTVRSRDELGDLAGSFNRMAGDLATKEKIRGVLNKVVAKEVADELLQGDLGLGGRLARATLLFADLRGFTAMTQGVAPQAVVAMLNEYMTAMTREIFACRGIVDKYVGDEIIGVFGAPKVYGHDAFAAVEAAHRMRVRLARLNEKRAARGERPLAMGIGVHTGDVVAGCMGSEELLNYTCIGEAVNLASRLCSNAKAGQILISEETRREAGLNDADVRVLDPIPVKGFREPVPVYEVLNADVGETVRRRRAPAASVPADRPSSPTPV